MQKKEKMLEEVSKFLRIAEPYASSFVTGGLTLLSSDPKFAILFGILGIKSEKIINLLADMAGRNMSEREKLRVSLTGSFALDKMYYYYDNGKRVRSDDFFQSDVIRRSNMEELLEGVLLKAKNEYEEKKVRYISNILASAVYTEGLSINELDYLLTVVGRLTYRQLCLLSLFLKKDNIKEVILRQNDYDSDDDITYETRCIIQEIYDLYNLGLVHRRDPDDTESRALLDAGSVAPNSMMLESLGKRFCVIMDLFELDNKDIIEVAKHIS